MLNQAGYSPALAQDIKSTVTWASSTTKTVSDDNVRANSTILVIPTSVPNGRWAVTSVSANSFTVTSSDAESGATFIYKIL